MSPDGVAFIDGTAQVRAARAGLRPAPTARVGAKVLRFDGHRDGQETRRGCAVATLAGDRVSCAKGRRLLLLFRLP